MQGCFYGVGVGPGDPELMTLKAARILREVPVIAFPGKEPEDSTAWKIAAAAVQEIREKEKLGVDVPMTRDADLLQEAHRRSVRQIEELLELGKSVAYITLGDPTVYSSFSYLQAAVIKDGYRVETVSGVPSFCAAAARLNIPLTEWQEELHILPAAHMPEGNLSLPGTVVCMKAGKKLKELKEQAAGQDRNLYMVSNCGLEGEMVCHDSEEIPDKAGYYTILISTETVKNSSG